MLWLVSAISLFVIMATCMLGVFTPSYIFNDNLFQRLGMTGMFFFSLPKFLMVVEQQSLQTNCLPALPQVLGHVGTALFCLGTMWHVIRRRRGIYRQVHMINTIL